LYIEGDPPQMLPVIDNINTWAGPGNWKWNVVNSIPDETTPCFRGPALIKEGIIWFNRNVEIKQILASFDKDDDAWATKCDVSFEEALITLQSHYKKLLIK